MFERIVVPADLSERNREAVELAGRIARPGGTIHLVHVIEMIPGLGIDEERVFYRRLEERATEHLSGLAAALEDHDVQYRSSMACGPRAQTILQEAERVEAEIIVIRSHRVGEHEPRSGSGTLSYQIGVLAPCPVLLVK